MKKLALVLVTATALSGCLFEKDDKNKDADISGFNAKLVLATSAPDYSSSDIVVIGNSDTENDVVIEGQLATTEVTDAAVASFGDTIYRLSRSTSNITEINWNATNKTLSTNWQYSVLGDDTSANPYDMLVVSGSKAYVARYDSKNLWQINPGAKTESEFKTAEIDLSAFADDESGITRMADLELVGNRLFVLLQNLETVTYYATYNSKVAVIDTTNNQIIDTDDATANVQVITLPIHNATDLNLVGDTLYISGRGDAYNFGDATFKYTGGIVTLNTETFASELVVDDGDSTSAPYGTITNTVANASGDIYFTGSASWGDDHLYVLPNGATQATEIRLGSNNYNISDLAFRDGNIYVAVHAQNNGSESAGLKVIDTSSNELSGMIETTYNPTQIVISG
ncbi:MAG: hypothetical protein P8X74_06580 [Reinekea sp.]